MAEYLSGGGTFKGASCFFGQGDEGADFAAIRCNICPLVRAATAFFRFSFSSSLAFRASAIFEAVSMVSAEIVFDDVSLTSEKNSEPRYLGIGKKFFANVRI